MNTIFWKGVSSTTIDGLLICELPPISKPPMRVKETTIDGRDGSTIEDLGYAPYDKAVTIGLRGNFNINKVIKYFTGEGEIIFSNEPDKVYTAKVISQIDYNRILRFRKAVVKFRVQPYKCKYNEAYKETQTATAEGTSIVVTDSAEANLKAFSIYGKSTQNGTPTPDAPVDIVSLCADGTIDVTVNDTKYVIDVPELRGIPVDSRGNHTDANGQQWICDEIDIAKGLYVQRVEKVDMGTLVWEYDYTYNRFLTNSINKNIKNGTRTTMLMTNVGYDCKHRNERLDAWGNAIYVAGSTVYIHDANYTNIDDFKAEISGKTLLYPLGSAIETTFPTLQYYKNINTVSNDENAHMKVEYFKPFEVFNEGLEDSNPIMVLHGNGTVGISVNGVHIFDYTFPEGETEVVIDSEKEDAYLGEVLKNRNMNGEFPVLLAGTNKIEWSGDVESIEILPRSRWL